MEIYYVLRQRRPAPYAPDQKLYFANINDPDHVDPVLDGAIFTGDPKQAFIFPDRESAARIAVKMPAYNELEIVKVCRK